MLGLIGDARMTGAIWSFARFLRAAEAKFRLGRIADRPTAHRLAQFHNGHVALARVGQGNISNAKGVGEGCSSTGSIGGLDIGFISGATARRW
jgi:hypothetical protein